MAQADLIIKAKDLEDIERELTQVSQSFAAYAKTTDSLEDAVGEPKLGGKLKWFAERWRIKRDQMSEQFEALRKEVQVQREAWDDTDEALAGEGDDKPNDDKHDDDKPNDNKQDDDKPNDNKQTDDKLGDDTPIDNNSTPQPTGPGSGGQSGNSSGDGSKTTTSTDDLGSETAVEGPGAGMSNGGGGDGAGS
ncbi:MAG: hypothetical protein LBL55_05440, partial [Propionibacteriaceae bacterium]|nr:hypothetical protein [Propionibacteriaceae bacterium]